MKELTKDEFIKELRGDRQGVDFNMGVEGTHENDSFYRSEGSRLYGILIRDAHDNDWGYVLFYRLNDGRVVNYATAAGMEKQEAIEEVRSELDRVDRVQFRIAVGSLVLQQREDSKFFAVIHAITPITIVCLREIGVIPEGCVLTRLGPFDSLEEAKQHGRQWIAGYHQANQDTVVPVRRHDG